MLTMLKNWEGKVEINGTEYENIERATIENKRLNGEVHIKLYPLNYTEKPKQTVKECGSDEVVVTVKPYMTRHATPEFDFMAKWNDDNPMPMRIMQGKRIKETAGMVYMELHGLAKPTITCFCCGKELTNPISRHYGVGPVCLSKLGITFDIDDEENIKEELVKIEWKGWVIKSSILSEVSADAN